MTTQTTTTTQIENRNSKIENPLPNATPLLPRGHLTLLLGDPGIGKSLLAIDFAARISNNSPPLPHPHLIQPFIPDDQIPPGHIPDNYRPANVFLLCREDSHDTISERLYAAGANLRYTGIIEDRVASLVPHDLAKRPSSIFDHKTPANSPLLNHFSYNLERYGPISLIILDPLPACLGIHDAYHPSTIRNLLTPLLDFAQKHHIAILGISHLTKSRRAKNPLHHILGSIAYPALARSILYLTTNDSPLDGHAHSPQMLLPDGASNSDFGFRVSGSPPPIGNRQSEIGNSQRLLIPVKNNLIPLTHAYAFSFAPKRIPPVHPAVRNSQDLQPFDPEDPDYLASYAPRIEWDPTPITDHPLLRGTAAPDPDAAEHLEDRALALSQLDLAKQFLQTALAHGPLLSTTLHKQARSLAISQRTLDRAKLHLNIKTHHDGHSNTWLVSLPPPTS